MKKVFAWLYLIAALALTVAMLYEAYLHAAAPVIVQNADSTFTVTFDKGATFACTTFYEETPTEHDPVNFPDGHYAPKKCYFLDAKEDTDFTVDWEYIQPANDDWTVSAILTYLDSDEKAHEIETNKLRVHR